MQDEETSANFKWGILISNIKYKPLLESPAVIENILSEN